MTIIARISFQLRGAEAVATLGDDMRWTAPDPIGGALQRLLETEDASPSAGHWVPAHVERIAKLLGGTVIQVPASNPVPGRIY